MRNATTLSRCFTLTISLFLFACKKNTENVEAQTENLTISKVTAWLANQKSAANEERNRRIDALADNLDFSKRWLEESSEGEQLIIVPIKESLALINNKGKTTINTLLLIADKAGNIRKGNIVQFLPKDKALKSLPRRTFHTIYNSRKFSEDGTFVFLSITDLYQSERNYENGRLVSSKKYEKQLASAAQRNDQNCIDWYLITTWYYADGHTETTEEYVGRTCGCGNSDPTQVQDFCDDESGTPGGDTGYEYETGRLRYWTVYTTPDGNNTVWSNQWLNGKRDGDASVFSNIRYDWSDVHNSVPRIHNYYAYWIKDSWTYSLSADKKTGTTTIRGRLTYDFAPEREGSKYHQNMDGEN